MAKNTPASWLSAVDRATRLVFLGVYENKDKEAATDFLKRCLEFFPFKVEKILTGAPFGSNGREFTLHGFKNRYGGAKTQHPFDAVCREAKIQHRLTRPYTPQTGCPLGGAWSSEPTASSKKEPPRKTATKTHRK
jgi:hypothetical protein